MGVFRWLFCTIQGLAAFVLLVGGAVLTLFDLGDRFSAAPVVPPAPAVSAVAPALPDAVPRDFAAPLAARLAAAFAAAGCAPGAVAVADFAERLSPAWQTSHGAEGTFIQLELATPGNPVTVQGNGRGAAALADARASLLDNIEPGLKGSDRGG
jgi:hypothetical protein